MAYWVGLRRGRPVDRLSAADGFPNSHVINFDNVTKHQKYLLIKIPFTLKYLSIILLLIYAYTRFAFLSPHRRFQLVCGARGDDSSHNDFGDVTRRRPLLRPDDDGEAIKK